MTEISPHGGTGVLDDTELFNVVVPAIPCEYVTGMWPATKPCENEAHWIMHVAAHCSKSTAPAHKLLCDRCMEKIKAGDVWKCLRCNQHARVIDYVTKIERI